MTRMIIPSYNNIDFKKVNLWHIAALALIVLGITSGILLFLYEKNHG